MALMLMVTITCSFTQKQGKATIKHILKKQQQQLNFLMQKLHLFPTFSSYGALKLPKGSKRFILT